MQDQENIMPLLHEKEEVKVLPSLKRGQQTIKKAVETIPDSPGIYKMLCEEGKILYIGKAKNLKKRVVSYSMVDKLPHRLRRMVSQVYYVEVTITKTETEALLLESNLIKKHYPPFNIQLKDDKSFPYILIETDHSFPRITKYRGAKKNKGHYFGPFASSQAVDETLVLLQKVFRLRTCSDNYFQNRQRPCLQYYIKRCSGPCVDKVNQESYQSDVQQAKQFLSGKNDIVQQYLSEKMQEASDKLDFEKAASYRDRLKLLQYIQGHQRINVPFVDDCDVFAIERVGNQTCVQFFFFRHGRHYGGEALIVKHVDDLSLSDTLQAFLPVFYQERPVPDLILISHAIEELSLVENALSEMSGHKKLRIEHPRVGPKKEIIDHALLNAKAYLDRLLTQSEHFNHLFQELKEVFNLPEAPKRIEVYDNSHLQGSYPYGVMIVATQEGFDKKSYRKFKIDGPCQDDFAMMREVFQRRLKHQEDWEMPGLFLIDGGQGQLSAVTSVLNEYNITIPAVGIAKGVDRNAGREEFYFVDRPTLSLPEHSPLLHFLQRIRDEAHRFAIGTHRAKRMKALRESSLDAIPGIGGKRKKALLHHFGSAQSVSRADINDLLRVPGINKAVAQTIYNFFHG